MKRLFVALLSLIILLTGCSSGSGSFVYVVNKPFETLDPVDASYTHTFQLFANVYQGVYKVNQNSELELGGAEEVILSEDGLTYTIKLRDDVHWVNNKGEDMGLVTANDYVTGYRRMVDPNEASIFSYIFEAVDNTNEILAGEMAPDQLAVTALDDYTLEIKLDTIAPYFDSLLAFGSFVPQPAAAIEQYGDEFGTTAETTWYNGPYYVTSYEPDYIVSVEKNPLYVAADNVTLESVDFRVNEDSTSRYNAFLNEEADYVEIQTPEDYEDGKANGVINDKLTSYSYYAVLNAREENVTGDETLRKALAAGFDRQTIVEGVFGNINQPIEYIIPADLTTSSYGGVDYHDFSSDSLLTYNKEEASKYFDQYMKEQGLTDRSQIEIELLASSDATGNSKFAEVVQSTYLQEFGITVNLTVQPFEQFITSKKSGAFDMYLQSWGPDFADPATYLGLWQSSQVGSQNYSGYSNPEFDRIYNEALKEANPQKRFELFAQLEKMIVDDGVAIPFYQLNSPYALTEGYTMGFDSFNQISQEYTTYEG
ncbi:peptide ABC transporter substrate-binding protein [Mollicutes bacterium LVI A0039]|nr:peptide ABC transporter substrate-binding protein [Mollicutes bacterium LVI A0039]